MGAVEEGKIFVSNREKAQARGCRCNLQESNGSPQHRRTAASGAMVGMIGTSRRTCAGNGSRGRGQEDWLGMPKAAAILASCASWVRRAASFSNATAAISRSANRLRGARNWRPIVAAVAPIPSLGR